MDISSASGITKEFLESVLRHRVHKFCINPGSILGDNFSCDLYGVCIWVNPGVKTADFSILIKCYPTNVAKQKRLDSTNSFETEFCIYHQVLPELYRVQPMRKFGDLNFPRIIFGQRVPTEQRASGAVKPVDNCIILPDLGHPQGFRLRDKFLGLDEPHMSLVVYALAKLHAVSWAYKCKYEVKKLHVKYPLLKKSMSEQFLSEMEGYKNRCYALAESVVPESRNALVGLRYLHLLRHIVEYLYYDSTEHEGNTFLGRTKDTLLRKPGRSVENEQPWAVLCHGDVWNDNILFRYEDSKPVDVAFVDLQFAREGDPCTDLVYCLYLSTTREFRTAELIPMLHLYYIRFCDICDHFRIPDLPGWSWEELTRRFDRAKIYGGHMAVCILPIIFKHPTEMQPMEEAEPGPSSEQTEQMSTLLTRLPRADSVHPILRERYLDVLEELSHDGVI